MLSRLALVLIVVLSAAPHVVHADSPVAIVEEVSAGIRDVALFDFFAAGHVIDLGSEGRLVLGYLSGCVREEIIGGRVIVGAERSAVEGGKVQRQTVECDGGGLQLTSAQSGKSGVQVVRADPAGGAAGEPKPKLTLYGASPIVLAAGATGSAVFQRLDRAAPKIVVSFAKGAADLAKDGRKLARGGIYRASAGDQSKVFRVDRYARPGFEPLLSRLVLF